MSPTTPSARPGTSPAGGESVPAKRRLGRGLGALIGSSTAVPIAAATLDPLSSSQVIASATPRDAASVAPAHAVSGAPGVAAAFGSSASHGEQASTSLVRALPLEAIVASPFQPRQAFEQGALDALAASIRAAGVMQPIVVRRRSPLGSTRSTTPASGQGPERFEIIAGERRFRAARQLGLPTIPAIVREIDDRTAAEWAIIENLQREDLNPIERAAAFRRLVEEFGLSQQEVGEQVGLDRSTVANLLRLNDLDEFTADAVRQGRLSMGHARALLACTDSASRRELAAAAIRGGWSVRKTEQQVAAGGARQRAKGASVRPVAAHLAALERRLGAQLGTRVSIEPGRAKGAGRLVIEYFSLDQFEGLLGRMGVDGDALRDA